MTLVLSLIVLLSLSTLVLAMLAMSAFEPLIAQNLVDTMGARMLADSGLELAYDRLVSTASWNTVLATATAASCKPTAAGVLLGPPDMPLPALTAANGTFTVRVRNDCQAGDPSITGVPAEPSASFGNDANDRLILESTGVKNTAVRTIGAVIRRARIPAPNAALAFPGVQANVTFSGSSLVIDGRDTRLTDAAGMPTGTAAPLFGISTSSLYPAEAAELQAALASEPQNDVWGVNANGAGTIAHGVSAIAPDGAVSSQQVSAFVSAVRSLAHVGMTSSAGSEAAVADIGASCARDIDSATCWGTDAHPKIVHVKANLATVDQRLTALAVSGSSRGTGILIVEDGALSISGDFVWHGPIIVTGANVAVRYQGGGTQTVLGAMIVNETRGDGGANLESDPASRARMAYSKEAMDLVSLGLTRRLTTLYSWREK